MLTIKQQNDPSSHYKSRKTQPQQAVNKEENEPRGLPIDFVIILPFEIIVMIFEAFPTETLFTCMDVSPGWQRVLQKCPSLWEEIILENELNYNKWIPKYYPLMGMHIKSYTISKPDQGGLDLSVEQILEGSMNNLTSLAWNCGNVCDIVGSDILKCLRQLRHSLISLELSTDADLRYLEGFDIPPLAAILSACPSLKRLKVTIPYNSEFYDDTLADEYPSTSALTHLIWSCGINLTKKDTQKLFTACPSLVYAQFDSEEEDDDDEEENITPLMVHNTCPKSLRYLYFNYYADNTFPNWYSDGVQLDDDDKDLQGLKSFAVPFYYQEDWIDIAAILKKDQKTLSEIAFYHSDRFDLAAVLDLFRGSSLKLTHSTIPWYGEGRIEVQFDQEIKEDEEHISFHQPTTARTTYYRHQRRRYIDSKFDNKSVDKHLPWLMDGIFRLSQKRTLSSFSIRFNHCGPKVNNYLNKLLEFPSSSSFQGIYIAHTPLELVAVTELIHGLQEKSISVQKLWLGPIPQLTDEVLISLFGRIIGLKQLVLIECDGISDQGVQDLLDHFATIASISSSSSLSLVNQQPPKLDFIRCKNVSTQRILNFT